MSTTNTDHIRILLDKYLSDSLTPEEYDELMSELSEEDNSRIFLEALSQKATEFPSDEKYDPSHWEEIISGILNHEKTIVIPKHRFHWFYRVAAAAVLLLVGFGAWYGYIRTKDHLPVAGTITKGNSSGDVLPGGNKAILTLSNGTQMVLDSQHTNPGLLQKYNGTFQLNVGSIAYNSNRNTAAPVTFNTLVTPRGGQYQLILADGSKVWLNSSSSIRFPVSFSGKNREVSLTGEAYFEIAKDENKPFVVDVGHMKINVLGTQFNVMAYADEDYSNTTLVEGAVKITTASGARKLLPGQQINLNHHGDINWVKNIDVEEAIAWKNGLFDFVEADIPTIMRKLSRWYDIEVEFSGGIPSGQITGKIPRDTKLSNVLKMLELSGVHYAIDGHKVIIFKE